MDSGERKRGGDCKSGQGREKEREIKERWTLGRERDHERWTVKPEREVERVRQIVKDGQWRESERPIMKDGQWEERERDRL